MIKIFDFTNVGEIGGKRLTLEDLAKDPITCVMIDLAQCLHNASYHFDDPDKLKDYAVYSIERAIADIKFLSLLYSVIFDKGELADYVKKYMDICDKWLTKYKEVGDNGEH